MEKQYMLLIASAIAMVLRYLYTIGLIPLFYLRFTKKWYGTIFQTLPEKARLLDVGSGITSVRNIFQFGRTSYKHGSDMIVRTVQTILTKELKVVCMEENSEKFQEDERAIRSAKKITGLVLHNKSIYDKDLSEIFKGEYLFHAVCFSSHLLSLRDPVAALGNAMSFMKDKEKGVVYIPLVLNSSSMIFQILSPLFKLLQISTMAEVMKVVEKAGMEVLDDLPAVGSDEKKPHPARVLVLQKAQGTTSQLKGKEEATSDSNVRSRKGD